MALLYSIDKYYNSFFFVSENIFINLENHENRLYRGISENNIKGSGKYFDNEINHRCANE